MNKKGQMSNAISNLLTLGLGIMVLGIALAYGLSINQDIQDGFVHTDVANCGTNSTGGSEGTINYNNCGYAYNSTVDSTEAIANVTSKAPTISKVGVAVVIIGLIVAGFGVYFMKR